MKKRILFMLVLLMAVVTGAWAQGPATYAVTLAEGTEDADKWTGKVGAATDYQALPLNVVEGAAVSLKFDGTRRVKSVKAVKKAPSVPDGAINGKFSVNATKQVYFSKGNLRYASSTWSFFDNQYDYYTSYSADAWDHFGWSTSATTYGMNTSTSDSDYSGDFVDWGATMGTGWFTLSSAEWEYLFNTRSASTVGTTANARYAKARVNNVYGMILFPDTYTHPDGVTAPTGVNVTGNTGWYGNNYSSADWTKMESAGCVFLPAAGYRNGSSVYATGSGGDYWSTTSNGENLAYDMRFNPNYLEPTRSGGRCSGYPVRLVREVATTDAPATGNSVDLSKLTENTELKDGDVVKGTLAGNYKISIADGATVTLDGVTINGVNDANYEWAGITCLGDATIILSGTNTVKGFYENYPGIQAAAGKTLIINGTGSLTASSYGKGAGIGGVNNVACGNIEIQGGTITATSVTYGAGIGGGDRADCGNITISGGTVNATGGERGAGIGGGRRGPDNGSCGNILISGGTVEATGGDNAAGIGGGRGYNSKTFSSCGTITITSGVTKVTATMGDGATNSIGAGKYGTCGTVTIGGDATTYADGVTASPFTYEPGSN